MLSLLFGLPYKNEEPGHACRTFEPEKPYDGQPLQGVLNNSGHPQNISGLRPYFDTEQTASPVEPLPAHGLPVAHRFDGVGIWRIYGGGPCRHI